jgi:hypothetical protein
MSKADERRCSRHCQKRIEKGSTLGEWSGTGLGSSQKEIDWLSTDGTWMRTDMVHRKTLFTYNNTFLIIYNLTVSYNMMHAELPYMACMTKMSTPHKACMGAHHAHLPRDRVRSHVLHQIRGKANRIWNLQVEAFFVEKRRNVRDFSSSHFCLAAPWPTMEPWRWQVVRDYRTRTLQSCLLLCWGHEGCLRVL